MIHEPAIARLEQLNPADFKTIFDAMIFEAEDDHREVGQVWMPLVEEGDKFVVGSWVPEVWFVVRRVLDA